MMEPLFLTCRQPPSCYILTWARDRARFRYLFFKGALIPLMLLNISGSDGKEFACSVETWVWFLGWEDPLEKEMATHHSIPAWRIPWTEEPDSYSPWGYKELDRTEPLTLLLIPLIRAPPSGPNYLPNAPPPNTQTRGLGLPPIWTEGCIQSIPHHYCIKNQLKAPESPFPDYDRKLEAIHAKNCRR